MRRRQFIALISAATAWPRAVCAQQPAVRVIGFLSSTSPESYGPMVAAFRKGLSEAGTWRAAT